MIELLYDPRSAIATGAVQALSQLRPEAVPAVLEDWFREESYHRPFVIQALGQFGPAAQPARSIAQRTDTVDQSTLSSRATASWRPQSARYATCPGARESARSS